jgi:hypothetical protein
MLAPYDDPNYPNATYQSVDISVHSEHVEIMGRVFCCEGDEIAEFGINDATITINALGTQCQTSTFARTSGLLGRYEMEIPLIASSYQITVEKEGYEIKQLKLTKEELGASTQYELDFYLKESTSEEGDCSSGAPTVLWNGKEWQRCPPIISSSSPLWPEPWAINMTWAEADNYCTDLALDGHTDWRLPTKHEIKELIVCHNDLPPLSEYLGCTAYFDFFYDGPTTDDAFLDFNKSHLTADGNFWSRTITDSGNAWYVNFSEGFARTTDKKSYAHVRCIR